MSLAVGIEIGGTKLQAGVGLRDGKLASLVRRTVDSSKGGAGIREQIPSLVDEAVAKAGASPKDLVGLGIGFGGPVDTKRGRILLSHQIEGWSDFPLREWLQKKVEVCDDHFGQPQRRVGNKQPTRRYNDLGHGRISVRIPRQDRQYL